MSEVIEVETKNGEEELIDIDESVNALTKKKMLEILNTTTKMKNGEVEHEINDSASKSIEIMNLLVDRELKNEDFSANDLTEDSKMKIAQVKQEYLSELGMDVKKKEVK